MMLKTMVASKFDDQDMLIDEGKEDKTPKNIQESEK